VTGVGEINSAALEISSSSFAARAPRILCVFCADFNFSLYGEKIEMDFAAEVVCSRKAIPITKQ
jgi:hypothetical protein